MITFAAEFAVVCCASLYVENRKARLEQNKEKESVRSFLQSKSFSQKCTVEDFLKVNSYIAKYYDPLLLLEFISRFEDTMNKNIDINALNAFLDDPKKMNDQMAIMLPVHNSYELQAIDV
ncbi:hypothetical protein [Vibrio sp. 10N.239.312.D08]|uniref:hypothetical protein n=1 Tax=Vibrio sp. 10N.239.312.D08 TaxID=3229978 RepID=UPI00354B8769